MISVFLAAGVSTGFYTAVWKLVLFVLFFGLWAWVGQWLDKDTLYVRANRHLWNYIYFGSGMLAALLVFLLPALFIVNFLLFVVTWATVTFAYVFHRNANLSPSERILTVDHLRSILSREHRIREVRQRLVFISASKNVIPVPPRQDPEFDAYVAAEDLLYDVWFRRVTRAELLPIGDSYQIRYVIDGVLGLAGEKTRPEAELAVGFFKEIARLEVKDRRKPQVGNFKSEIEGASIEWRIKTAGTTRGEQIVLERLEGGKKLALAELGFDSEQLEVVQKVVAEKSGIVLISGPPASGLTSTAYSMLRSHDAFIQNVHSFEKEIEITIDNITQHALDLSDPSKNAARQLQTVIRIDPDVILIGFLENADMAKLALQAARDGKKIYIVLNAAGALESLQKWLDVIADPAKVAETLRAITCQRLIRKLCPQCRVAYKPDVNLVKKLNLPADRIKQFYRPPKDEELEYDKKGNVIPCSNCQGTGYFGRTAVFETFIMTDALRALLRDNAPLNAVRAQSRKDRMRYLQEQALRKVIDGTTSIQEVSRLTADRPGAAPAPKPNE